MQSTNEEEIQRNTNTNENEISNNNSITQRINENQNTNIENDNNELLLNSNEENFNKFEIEDKDGLENLNVLIDLMQDEEIERLKEEISDLKKQLERYNDDDQASITHVNEDNNKDVNISPEKYLSMMRKKNNNDNDEQFVSIDGEQYKKFTGLDDFDDFYNDCNQSVYEGLEEYNKNNLENIVN